MPKVEPEIETFARIKVVGCGGSGANAVNHMVNSDVKGVDYVVMNTDAQDLHHSAAQKKIHIGKSLTKGLGTGMNPDMGRKAAEESREEIQESLQGADMVFVACGMGGGTGTGAAPTIARTAREEGALTVGVVTKPFFFEGAQRSQIADEGLENLKKEVDAIIAIPNDRLLEVVEKETSFESAFSMCDEVLRQAVEGISHLITTPGIVNVDFADIRSVMADAGSALMGIGYGSGEKRAEEAAMGAINSPLLDLSIDGARGVLFAIAGGSDMTMHEAQEAAKLITESVDPEAKVIFGAIKDEKLKKNELKITVIASGFPEHTFKQSRFEREEESAPPVSRGRTQKQSANTNNAGNTSNTGETTESGSRANDRAIYNTLEEHPRSTQSRSADTRSTSADTDAASTAGGTAKEQAGHENDTDDDDDEDWNAIPAFLRRSRR